jgi:hypothetical protein
VEISFTETANESGSASRASPELGVTEIQGQVFDSTSGLTFLHRARRRLTAQKSSAEGEDIKRVAESQPMTIAGDKPLPSVEEVAPLKLPEPPETKQLITLYFEVCIATFRILHKPTVETWLCILERNIREAKPLGNAIGHAKAAIVLIALAIAKTHHDKRTNVQPYDNIPGALSSGDQIFCVAERLLESEIGYPRLESAQARLIQVLYLLTTSRFNRSWYIFGTALQIISALGLHRQADIKRKLTPPEDYLQTQCGLRTFWTAYILDNYLGVIFGRPRHFNDSYIDQKLPERADDDKMTTEGPGESADPDDCHIDALIFHAKIAKIIGSISYDLYSVSYRTEQQKDAAVSYWMEKINEWHSSLPAHLGSVRPSMLIPSYKRQAIAMTLAHSHAIMHANRLFLLGRSFQSNDAKVETCLAAAKRVLETVDAVAKEGPIFHAFWWTHYVTFCALVVTYVWEIQKKRLENAENDQERGQLLKLAELCQQYLAKATASNSPSRRYAVILEEFKNAAQNTPRGSPGTTSGTCSRFAQPEVQTRPGEYMGLTSHLSIAASDQDASINSYPSLSDPHVLDTWQLSDWLDIDSSVSRVQYSI